VQNFGSWVGWEQLAFSQAGQSSEQRRQKPQKKAAHQHKATTLISCALLSSLSSRRLVSWRRCRPVPALPFAVGLHSHACVNKPAAVSHVRLHSIQMRHGGTAARRVCRLSGLSENRKSKIENHKSNSTRVLSTIRWYCWCYESRNRMTLFFCPRSTNARLPLAASLPTRFGHWAFEDPQGESGQL